jgi:alkyl sulfatase BDS1-like metallo-beta-lactamase superfamily hydrolase
VSGLTGTVQHVVSGGPDGSVKYFWILEDGELRDAQLGTRPEPDITLTIPYADMVGVLEGEVDVNVLYMQGRMKTAGDPGKLLQLLRGTTTPAYRAAQERTRSITGL